MTTGKIGHGASFEGYPAAAGKADALYSRLELPPAEEIHMREGAQGVVLPAWAEYTRGEYDPSIGSQLSAILETATPQDRAKIRALIREDIAVSVASVNARRS
jgi:hypothetical protein